MWYRLFILVVIQFWLSTVSVVYAQQYEYKIEWKNDSMGHLEANRYDSAGYEIYTIDSEVELWFFGTKNIRYNYYSRYRDGRLLVGYTSYTKNNDLKASSTVQYTQGKYEVFVDGELQDMEDLHDIDYSVTTIYHREPQGVDKIFSERFAVYVALTPLEPHHYSLEKPDGRPTEYFYENGICSKVVIDNFFATFTFIRVR